MTETEGENEMKTSEKIDQLAQALLKFHMDVKPIERDGTNVLTKGGLTSKYATLDNIIESTKQLLAKYGVIVVQDAATENGEVTVKTRLFHASGQWMESDVLRMKPVKNDPQGIGGAITYARRYQLAALLNLATEEDDDGNYASGRTEARTYTNRTANKKPEQDKKTGADKLKLAQERTIDLGVKCGMTREEVMSMVMDAAKDGKPTLEDYRTVYNAIKQANEEKATEAKAS
jgi:hypothetical protein